MSKFDVSFLSTSNPLPHRLKEARKRAGLSQKALGLRIGMEPNSASSRMNHYEKGRHMPDYPTLEKLSEQLDVPIAFFFCESDISAKLLCLIEKLSDKEKQSLIKQLELKRSDE